MATVALSGSDTIMINNRLLADLADGDCVTITFPNEIASLKTGKNGNSLYSANESGKQCDVVLRIVRGSADDKFLNNLMTIQQSNFAKTILLTGEFIKQMGDGLSNVLGDSYLLSGGIFTKLVEAKTNVEGDTEQSLCHYHLKFSRAPRVLA